MAFAKSASLLTAACILVFFTQGEGQTPDPELYKTMGKMSKTINQISTVEGISISEIGKKSLTAILKITPAQLQSVGSAIRKNLSPTLVNLLNTMPLNKMMNYHNSFQQIPGQSNYNFTSLVLLSMASSFDQPTMTQTTVKTLAHVVGKFSIPAFLNSTQASLFARNYLSDVYPLLLKNLPSILDKSTDAFFLATTKMPLKYYKAMVQSPPAINNILKHRKKMAIALVKGSQSEYMKESKNFASALMTASQKMAGIMQKLPMIQSMLLNQAPQKCNITSSDLKMKTLLQLFLRCLKLPEDFPITSLIPQQQFSSQIYSTKIDVIAKTLKMPLDMLLKNTMMGVAILYSQAILPMQEAALGMPIFFPAKAKGIKNAEIQNLNVLDLASKLSGLSKSKVYARYNLSKATGASMENVMFKSLPDVCNGIVNVKYSLEHFYFLSMDSIIHVITNKTLTLVEKAKLLWNFDVPLNKMMIDSIGKIFKVPSEKILKSSLLNLLVKMSGVSEKDFKQRTKLTAKEAVVFNKITIKEMQSMSAMMGGQGANIILSPMLVQQLRGSPVMMYLFTPLNVLTTKQQRMSPNFTLLDLLKLNPSMKLFLLPTLKKLNISKSEFSGISLGYIRSAVKMSPESFGNETVFSLLQQLSQIGERMPPVTTKPPMDPCSTIKCPDDSLCTMFRGPRAVCRCSKRGYVMKKGKCIRIKGKMIQVKELKFNQKYKKEYADTNSKAFMAKAAEIEAVLQNSVCKKLGCTAVVVTAIKKGSILVDFVAVFESDKVTAADLQAATIQAMNSSEMAALNPEKSSKPQASKSDSCQAGMFSCTENSVCSPGNDGSHTCECKKGYKRDGRKCLKSGLSSAAVTGIIVAVCVVLIAGIVILVCFVRMRKRNEESNVRYDKTGTGEPDQVLLTGGNPAYGYTDDGKKDPVNV